MPWTNTVQSAALRLGMALLLKGPRSRRQGLALTKRDSTSGLWLNLINSWAEIGLSRAEFRANAGMAPLTKRGFFCQYSSINWVGLIPPSKGHGAFNGIGKGTLGGKYG